MCARTVTIHAKAASTSEFTKTLENQIIRLLRKQKGFQDEIALLRPGGKQVVAITFWDLKENADAYERNVHASADRLGESS